MDRPIPSGINSMVMVIQVVLRICGDQGLMGKYKMGMKEISGAIIIGSVILFSLGY